MLPHSIFITPTAQQEIENVPDPLANHQALDHPHQGHEDVASGDTAESSEPIASGDAAQQQPLPTTSATRTAPVTSVTVDHPPVVALVDLKRRNSFVELSVMNIAPTILLVGRDVRPESPPPQGLLNS